MQRFKVISLVDITRSQPNKVETDRVRLAQQANFNTLLQTIGLRANMEWNIDPKRRDGRLPDPIDGAATHWEWEFSVERDFLFQKDTDPVGLLLDDLHGVPVIPDLDNSVDIDPSVFQTQGPRQNIWVQLLV